MAGIKSGLWTNKEISKIRRVDRVFEPQLSNHKSRKKIHGWDLAVLRTRSGYAENLEKEDLPLCLSIMDRERYLDSAKATKFDLVIIGGGVTGAGIGA